MLPSKMSKEYHNVELVKSKFLQSIDKRTLIAYKLHLRENWGVISDSKLFI